jgi:hypothetical protein
MLGKVHTWTMTEKERLAYIAKNPIIKKDKRAKVDSYSNIHDMKRRELRNNKAESLHH